MSPQAILDELRRAAAAADFYDAALDLTRQWSLADDAFDAVRPIFEFMEAHPSLEYGMPGPLVHFAEAFHGTGYERELIDSLGRKPVAHTVWMLNRVINGTSDPTRRRALTDALRAAADHPLADPDARQSAQRFLARLA